jgi:L-2-hydroxyglutarate oxidase
VVASREEELVRLDQLLARGRLNGLTLERLTAEEVTAREPNARGVAGLWVAETGVVDYGEVARSMAARIGSAGGVIQVSSPVRRIRYRGNSWSVTVPGTTLAVGRLINCAGLYADRVARLAGLMPRVRIVPFRGEYYMLRPERAGLVRGLIYPVPDPALPFLGVHFTRRVDGTVDAGPNAVLAASRRGYHWADVAWGEVGEWVRFPGFWRMVSRHWRTGLTEVRRSLSRRRFVESLQSMVPEVRSEDLAPAKAGVRAQAVGPDGNLIHDFLIETQPGAVHVLNAPSPAATASLAIGREIANRLVSGAG